MTAAVSVHPKHPNRKGLTAGQVAAKRRRAGKLAAQTNAKIKFGGK